ncbi:response regulator transcription factor [Streptomyces puniciscabiei]
MRGWLHPPGGRSNGGTATPSIGRPGRRRAALSAPMESTHTGGGGPGDRRTPERRDLLALASPCPSLASPGSPAYVMLGGEECLPEQPAAPVEGEITMSGMGARVRVVVADDHPIYREGIARGLSLSGQVEVVGEAADGREALELIRSEKPQVAVVDYRMPHVDGLDVVHAVARDKLPTRVIVLSAISDSGVVFRAVEEGAAGYLPKDARRAEIVDAVLKAAKGLTVIPEEMTTMLAGEIRMRADHDQPVLTERERQVLQAFARGLSVPDTAAELMLGASTVKTHAQRLYEKLQVSDRAAAVAEAMRRGLLE